METPSSLLSTTFAKRNLACAASPSARTSDSVAYPRGGQKTTTASFISSRKTCSPSASFKLRGAYNKVASLSEAERSRGVITYSSGNHAQGVAYAARALGVKAVIVMPRNAPAVKREATAALGAEIILVGPASSERQTKAEELAAQHGYVIVPPYNDEMIIAGQGTMGLEILEDLPEVETVIVPVGGGGMLSGIATAIKLSKPQRKGDWRGTGTRGRCASQLAIRQDRGVHGRGNYPNSGGRTAHTEYRSDQL